MFTFMKPVLKLSTETVEVGGDTLFQDGNTQSVDGLETFTWSNPELGWTWWRTNLTIYVLNGFLEMKLCYQEGMKSGGVSLVMNS